MFTHPVYFAPLLKGFTSELGTGIRLQETRMMGLPGREISLTTSSAVWIQCTNVTDRQTDRQTNRQTDRQTDRRQTDKRTNGQTPGGRKTALPSRGKNLWAVGVPPRTPLGAHSALNTP